MRRGTLHYFKPIALLLLLYVLEMLKSPNYRHRKQERSTLVTPITRPSRSRSPLHARSYARQWVEVGNASYSYSYLSNRLLVFKSVEEMRIDFDIADLTLTIVHPHPHIK